MPIIFCVCVFVHFILCTAYLQGRALKIFLVIMPFQNHLLTTLLKLWPTPGPDFPSSPFWHPSNPDISGTEHIQLCQSTEHTLSLSWGLGIKTISARLFKFLFLYLLASKLHHSFLKHTDLKEGRNPTFKVTLLLQLWIVKGNKNF